MKTQKKTDVFEIVSHFQKKIFEERPSIAEMEQEVRMMKFKIRPLLGDMSGLDFKNPEFIEALWNIGKLDEFFQHNVEKIHKNEIHLFERLVSEMRYEFQDDLSKASLHPSIALRSASSPFEIEIYRERAKKLN